MGQPNVELVSDSQAFKKAKVAEYAEPLVSPPILILEDTERASEQKLGTAPGKAPTLQEIQRDRLTQIALVNWTGTAVSVFNDDLVREIYTKELLASGGKSVPLQRVMLLEISQYLEKYLWPHFDSTTASFEHVMSIILLVNEKFRENIPAWTCFHTREDVFPDFFKRVITLKEQQERPLQLREKISYTLFFINCFQSLGDEMVRSQALRLVGLQMWHALSPARLQRELLSHEQLRPHWQRLLKKEARAAKTAAAAGMPVTSPLGRPDVSFIPSMLDEFLQVLEEAVPSTAASDELSAISVDPAALLYCERFVELLIDMLSQLPTRKFVHALVEDRTLLVKCRMSLLYLHPRGRLFSQLVDLLRFYEMFEIDDHTGTQLTEDEVLAQHCARLTALQRLLFKQVPKLRELALSNVAAVEKRSELRKRLAVLTPEELQDLVCQKLHLVPAEDPWVHRPDFLTEVMLTAFERRRSQREAVNSLPLYPNEEVMWDENLVPNVHYSGESCLALPKLNLQFLTLHDHLLRNFNLFRLESTYEIREDISETVPRLAPRALPDGEVIFGGWSRMAVPLQGFRISEVKQPHIGEEKPSAVLAEATFSVGIFRGAMRSEWDELKEHDVLFLLEVQAPGEALSPEAAAQMPVPERLGLRCVRGCEVVEVRDEGGALMNDFTGRVKRDQWKPPAGETRTLLLALDPAQYQLDVDSNAGGPDGAPPAWGFNVLVRRKPKENNFKAILECIRDLMNEDATVPAWLHDIFLGYGDPGAARWPLMPNQLRTVDFKDTFLSAEHLCESFPQYRVRFVTPDGDEDASPSPPFRITLPPPKDQTGTAPQAAGKRKVAAAAAEPVAANGESMGEPAVEAEELLAEAYVPPDPGPYPQDQPRQNSVRFTPVQVEAIMSGVQPGLTMVVGPPGTGKTDTAVQILHVLYHSCPEQRTLLITHSNQALNDLFEKIMQRDVPARYLLRLGMGEQELATEQDFSRQGRVNAMLARRLELLAAVERLAGTLGQPMDAAYTCESAAHFWLLHVLARWEAFSAACEVEGARDPGVVKEKFPFTAFFLDAPGFNLGGTSYSRDMRTAQGCFRHLTSMFSELEECRAFELLKTTADRSNYLMARQAKVVAMTCTHAALKRRDFLALGFKYDNLVMEESAQILEIETFIPMLLQRPQDGRARLKRCILIGDHHQLPPVVKNMAFQKYSHMDQSLFTRFVRLGVPHVMLNSQGRARPSLAALYNWRYKGLGDLPAVTSGPAFLLANAGFAHDYQLVDVPDWEGRGESEPNPWFYQNLGEAEYVVSVFQYMRLLGYPGAKISILTTYNGQKHLIRDVIERRCAGHPLFGRPSKVTTVDRFQGQQNDYVLLSLVRTRAVGHLRDVRRLVVAMSRARLGLYVFARRALFEQCYELQPTFQLLLQRPDRLALVLGENSHPTSRALTGPCEGHLVGGLLEMADIVAHKYEAWVNAQQMEVARQQAAAAGVAALLAHAHSKGYGAGVKAATPAAALEAPSGAMSGFVAGGQLDDQPSAAQVVGGVEVAEEAPAVTDTLEPKS